MSRVFDAFPGVLTWGTLFLCVVGAVVAPQWTLFIGGFGAAYVALRFVIAGAANLIGLRQIQSRTATNWHDVYNAQLKPDSLVWHTIHHVVIIPNYKEPYELLCTTLGHLSLCDLAATNMIVVLAMEGAEADSFSKGRRLQAEFRGRFSRLYVTIHPANLPGEMQCKSANLAWSARWVRQELVERIKLNEDHIIVTAMDADTRWHPEYFTALTAHFALAEDRYSLFWQAPLRYQDNITDIHPVMRLVNDYGSGIELAYLAAPWWWAMPISSYSLSLRLVHEAGYWDTDVIADEWHMFIKAFFTSETRLRVAPIFLPFRVRVTIGDSLWDTIRNRYIQTLRHAWGSKEITYVVRQIIAHRDLPLLPGIRLLLRVAHDVMMAGFGWMLVSAGWLLPVLFHPELLHQFFRDPVLVPGLLLIALSFGLVFVLGAIYGILEGKMRLAEASAGQWKHEEHATRLSFVLIPVLIFVFVTLPVLHAQTLLMFGRSLQFRVTRKQ